MSEFFLKCAQCGNFYSCSAKRCPQCECVAIIPRRMWSTQDLARVEALESMKRVGT